MKSLQAIISDLGAEERRGQERWRVQLTSAASSGKSSRAVLIQDLSESGLMFSTAAPLALGETILIDLPEIGTTEAVVIWSKNDQYGCLFRRPIPANVISTAILRAPVAKSPAPADVRIEEFPIGAGLTVDQLASWKAEFERTHGSLGYRLVAFRQRSDGTTIAIAAQPEN